MSDIRTDNLNTDASAGHSRSDENPAPGGETGVSNEALSRIFHSLVLAFFAWLALWVFAMVTVVQWGFLLFTGSINANLKGFLAEVVHYITQVLRYLAFQTEEKPFPFAPWPHQAAVEKNPDSSPGQAQDR
jgi:hypothetical protein